MHRLLATRADFTLVWAGLTLKLLGQITLEESGDHLREQALIKEHTANQLR